MKNYDWLKGVGAGERPSPKYAPGSKFKYLACFIFKEGYITPWLQGLFLPVIHMMVDWSFFHLWGLIIGVIPLPLHFTPDLKLISFTNPFPHSHSYSFRTDFTDLNLYTVLKGHWRCLF